MSRSLVFVRDALPADAAILSELWVDVLRRGDEAERLAAGLREWADALLAGWMALTGHRKRRGQWRGTNRG